MTVFEYEDKTYELSMTRAGVRAAEAQGLRTSQFTETPFTALDLLFFASLYKYKVSPAKSSTMLEDLLNDGTFKFEKLFEELADAYAGLFGSGESE